MVELIIGRDLEALRTEFGARVERLATSGQIDSLGISLEAPLIRNITPGEEPAETGEVTISPEVEYEMLTRYNQLLKTIEAGGNIFSLLRSMPVETFDDGENDYPGPTIDLEPNPHP